MTITASRTSDVAAGTETPAETPFLEVYEGPIGLEAAHDGEVVPDHPAAGQALRGEGRVEGAVTRLAVGPLATRREQDERNL